MLSLNRIENLFQPNVWNNRRIKSTCLRVGEHISSALKKSELTDEVIKSVFDKNLPKSVSKQLHILDFNQMAEFISKTSEGQISILDALKILRVANGCCSLDVIANEAKLYFCKNRQVRSGGRIAGTVGHELQHSLRALYHKKNIELNKRLGMHPELIKLNEKAQLILVKLQGDLFCELDLDRNLKIPMLGGAKKTLRNYTKQTKNELREFISKSLDSRLRGVDVQGNADFLRFLKEAAASEKLSHEIGNLICMRREGSHYTSTTADLFPAVFAELKKVVNKRLKLQQNAETIGDIFTQK